MSQDGAACWRNAVLAARLFAVDPAGLGGVSLHARPGQARDAWLTALRGFLAAGAPMRRIPLAIADDRLLGGLDLAATLRAGRPVGQRGVLAECDGGVFVLAMAERMTPATAARLAAAADLGEVVLERDGLAQRHPCRAGMVLLDEGDGDDERPRAALLDRCSLLIDLDAIGLRDAAPVHDEPPDAARALLPLVQAGEDMLAAIAQTASALGVWSQRTLLLALRMSRAAAALDGRTSVTEADIALAARLVLAPRATQLPAPEPAPEPEGEQDDAPQDDPADDSDQAPPDGALNEMLLEAAKAAIPAGLLAALQSSRPPGRQARAEAGKAGGPQRTQRRGRPVGTQRGKLVAGARLNLLETLRCAAPWQKMRRAGSHSAARIIVRPEDFRVTRFEERNQSTVIFVVDASGSSALNRLAEAKGAVELLLADCYVRRDKVALFAFRGSAASLVLPPTSSLVRAKRSLAGLAGGGGTPVASAIGHAGALAALLRRQGQTPFIVMLTDGRANIALDGTPGRARAAEDAKQAARGIRAAGFAALLIDTSPVPQPQGRDLAEAMAARYLPLPYAAAGDLSQAVRSARDDP